MSENYRTALGIFQLIRDRLRNSYDIHLSVLSEEIVNGALTRHGKHKKCHDINAQTLDAPKMLCWIAGELINGLEDDGGKESQCGFIADAVLDVADIHLSGETNGALSFGQDEKTLIRKMIIQEYCGDRDHGVGMNGLYMANLCLLKGWRAAQSDESS